VDVRFYNVVYTKKK